MLFKCPELKSPQSYIEQLRNWHSIFAFLPHRLDSGMCAWLQKIERRYPEAWVGSVFNTLVYEKPVYRLPPNV